MKTSKSNRKCYVSRLPHELLSDIFIRWAFQDSDAVWVASLVCSHWRRVVLDCPMVWSRVYMIFERIALGEVRKYAKRGRKPKAAPSRGLPRPLSLWLERAQNTKIYLSIYARFSAEMLIERLTRELFVLTSQLQHLHELEIIVDSDFLVTTVFEALEGKYSHLHHFSVTFVSDKYDRDYPDLAISGNEHLGCPWNTLEPPTQLRVLKLRGCQMDIGEESFPFVMKHMEHLELLCGAYDGQLLKMLSYSLNLTTLKLTDLYAFAPSEIDPLALPHLKKLVLRNVSMNCCVPILNKLNLPNLRHFLLRNRGREEVLWDLIEEGKKLDDITAGFGKALATFTSHCHHLQSLEIEACVIPDRCLVAALRPLRSITSLQLNEMFVGGPAFRALSKTFVTNRVSQEEILCPALDHLALIGCDFVTYEIVHEFLRSRNLSPSETSPITSLQVQQCGNMSAEEISAIRESWSSTVVMI